MHAYAHQWGCQIVYNPRIRTGFGLSDGEGTERFWSRLRKLIPIARHSLVSDTSSAVRALLISIFTEKSQALAA